MQRPLVVEAGPSHQYYDDSPPRTPTHVKRVAKGKGRAGASRAVRSRPALRETFLENTAVEEHVRGLEKGYPRQSSTSPPERDTHDLSLSPRHVTRDSVVNNMLLSLDQFSTSGAPNPRFANAERSRSQAIVDGDTTYSAGLRSKSAETGRRRGHTQSSSLSFEPDLRPDDASSRSTTHFTRRRRSNSSTTFHSAPRRIDYNHREDESTRTIAKVSAAPRAAAFLEGGTTVASQVGRKGGKNSASSSFDMGRRVGASRRQRSIDRRSISVDQPYGLRGTYLSPSKGTAAVVTNSRSEPLLYDGYEAAPTPVVPVGLRRDHPLPSAVYPSQVEPSSSQAQPSRLQNSTESAGSLSAGWAISELDEILGVEGRREDYEDMRTNLQEFPSLHAFFNSPGRSPSASDEKPFTPSILGAAPSMRDRPGFFRRVFGSSRSNTSSLNDSRRPSTSFAEPLSLQTGVRAESRSAQGSQVVAQSKFYVPPVKDPTKDTSQAHLNKKSSSFFRRRKKSLSEQRPLPTFSSQPPFAANDGVLDQPADPSPVSSLRKVMNPYLHDTNVAHSEELQGEGMNDYDVAFMAGYTARNESSVKHYKAASVRLDPAPPSRKSPGANASALPKLDFNPPSHPDDSFLQDSSSNEGRSLPRTPNLQLDQAKESARRPKSNPETPKSGERSTPQEGKARPHMPSPTSAVRPGPREVGPGVNAKRQSSQSPTVAKSKQTANAFPDGAEPKEWITVAHLTSAKTLSSPRLPPGKSERVWLEPKSSDEDVTESTKLSVTLGGAPDSARASESFFSDYKSASSRLPASPCKPSLGDPPMPVEAEHLTDQPRIDTEPTELDRQQAKKIYDGDEDDVIKDKAAAWLGESGAVRTRVLRAYMELFQWRNLNILASLRDLCGRLLLKAETQQVDRILDAFSIRWCSCNSSHGFKATGM